VRATQLDMLRPAGPAPDRLAATIARLAALVGPENVGAPVVVDTWREEAVGVSAFALTTGAPTSSTTAAVAALAIRRLRPPQEIEVLVDRRGPTALRGRDTTARVLVAAGPYRASGEWWRGDEGAAEGGGGGRVGSPSRSGGQPQGGWARAYWDVHASDGAVYRVHQDERDGRWFLDGYYD
jgi:protein ImuB